jgi:hypothetical protein
MAQRPSDLAERISNRGEPVDGIMRETFRIPVEAARVKAREILSQAPQGGHMTIVEQWRQLSHAEGVGAGSGAARRRASTGDRFGEDHQRKATGLTARARAQVLALS